MRGKNLLFALILCLGNPQAWALTNSAPAESPDFESDIQIRTEGLDPTGDRVPGYCNAALVSPQALVTAAHCVKDAIVLKDTSTQIILGEWRYATRPDGKVVRVGYALKVGETVAARFFVLPSLARKIASQGFKTQIGPDEDVAVILLPQPLALKEGFRFAQVITNRDFRGITGSATTYLPTVVTVNPMAEVKTNDIKRMARLSSFDWSSGHFESKSSSRVEEGDSGSPVYVRIGKEWFLAAVVKGKAKSFWSDWDVFTGLDARMCQLAAQIPDASVRALVCRN